MFALATFSMLISNIYMLAPSPLITSIMSDTGWSLSAVGQFVSVILLFLGLGSLVASYLFERFGVVRTTVLAMMLIGLSGILPFFFSSYAMIYLSRVLFGIGFGLSTNMPSVVVTTWFSQKQRPLMQGLRTAIMGLSLALPLYIVLPINALTESWRTTLGIIGITGLLAAVLWAILGREIMQIAKPVTAKRESGLKQAAKRKETWLLAFAFLLLAWADNAFNTFLPTFLETERGFAVTEASTISGFINIGSIFGGLAIALFASIFRRKKWLTATMIVVMVLGIMGSIFLNGGAVLRLAVALVGVGYMAYIALWNIIPGELEGATPELVGGMFAIIFGISATSFFIPFVTEWLNGLLGMTWTMVLYGIAAAAGILPILFLKEGKREKG